MSPAAQASRWPATRSLRSTALRAGVTALAGHVLTRGWRTALDRLPERVLTPLVRVNHRGQQVTLAEGVAFAAGTLTSALIGLAHGGSASRAAAALVTGAGAAGAGALDDHLGSVEAKGLAGHLGALRQGRVTSGSAKIALLGATGLVAAVAEEAHRNAQRSPGPARPAGAVGGRSTSLGTAVDVVLGAGVVAGSANLINLFDLRPGRAIKVGLLALIPMALTPPGSPTAGSTIGAATAVLGDDLAARSMLGDTGANPLGALVGLTIMQRQGRGARALTVLVVAGLTLASERISFTRVIHDTPVLRALDEWGQPSGCGAAGEPERDVAAGQEAGHQAAQNVAPDGEDGDPKRPGGMGGR